MRQTDDKPAHLLTHQKDELMNAAAVSYILSKNPKPNKILDLMAGVGNFSAEAKNRWPGIPLVVNDLSEECANKLRDRFPEAVVLNRDCSALPAEKNDGVFCDFNLLTFKRLSTPWIAATLKNILAGRKPLWVVITDSAVGKLHLNYKVYGLQKPSITEYLSKYREYFRPFGYTIAGSARAHHRVLILNLLRIERR